MSGSGEEKLTNILQLKYKKINLSDLTFDQGDFFARGQFGDVKKAKWNGKPVAVKLFSSVDRKCGFKEELISLTLLQTHEHIVTMFGACNTGQPFIVLEFAPLSLEKVLHEYKKKYSYTSDHVMSWSLQTAKGLEYIHSKKMLHRDIKPSNILLFHHGKNLKLCDFGTAKKLESTLSMTNAVGTIRYMAPEVIKGKHYTDRCDIFSYGIVLWEMFSRRRPMPSLGQGNHYQIMFAMANGATPPKILNLPKPMSELIAKCFDPEPQKRPPVLEIRKKLEYLCKFVKPIPPLIPRRQPKPEPTQSDVFVADKWDTQHSPRVSADSAVEEDNVPAPVRVSSDSVFKENEVKVTPVRSSSSSKHDKPSPDTSIQQSPREVVEINIKQEIIEDEQARDRSKTVPERPVAIPKASERNLMLRSQVSSPATDTPSKFNTLNHPPRTHLRHPTPPDGYATVAKRIHNAGRGYGHQESEYEEIEFVSEELLSNNDLLQAQSERYQMIEEVMRRTTNFPVASGSSGYVIPGLEPELQPILPNENNPQSMELYRQYSAVAEDILSARKEYDDLMDENVKLVQEIESDRQKVAKQAELYQEYEKQCVLKDQLLSEYSRLDEEFKALKEQNSTLPST